MSALFIILVGLMMTLFNDKILISHRCIDIRRMWFDAQLDQKSWTVSWIHTTLLLAKTIFTRKLPSRCRQKWLLFDYTREIIWPHKRFGPKYSANNFSKLELEYCSFSCLLTCRIHPRLTLTMGSNPLWSSISNSSNPIENLRLHRQNMNKTS